MVLEDYSYKDGRDLDQHNGRFCKTPEFPNGVYAYFSLINPDFRDSEGSFKNYRKPQFPYMIGDSFKDIVPANELGMSSLFVLTGNGKEDLKKFDHIYKPDYIAKDLFLGAKDLIK